MGDDGVKAVIKLGQTSNQKDEDSLLVSTILGRRGYKAIMLTAPKGEAKQEVIKVNGHKFTRLAIYNVVKQVCVMGFTQAQQASLSDPLEGMDAAQKEMRAETQPKIGTRVRDVQKSLNIAEEKASPRGVGSNTRDADVLILEFIEKAKAVALRQEQGDVDFSITKVCTALNNATKVVKTKASKGRAIRKPRK